MDTALSLAILLDITRRQIAAHEAAIAVLRADEAAIIGDIWSVTPVRPIDTEMLRVVS